LSFLEFNYMILQAYDFLELFRREGCLLQMGGSDQWGNIVNGIDLTRRVAGAEVFGLTTPLLTTSDGRKMGKSAAGAAWLNAEAMAPYDFWQFWRNTTDADVGRFLKLYTELPIAECDRLGALAGSEINAAKIVLANEVTTLCHGPEAAMTAESTARAVFEEGGAGDALEVLTIRRDSLTSGVANTHFLVSTGIVQSGKEAKRLIAERGLRFNNELVLDPNALVTSDTIGRELKVSVGKKRHHLVRLES
jgi:tyrosyl-tRNA synthetase